MLANIPLKEWSEVKFHVDPQLFPFESRFVEIGGHQIHYVDEGEGPVLLMLHGNPSWAFVYRKLISSLRDSHRCIAMDYPGYGLSIAADGTAFSPRSNSEVVEAFVDRLDLKGVVVFCQDWSGPVGLGLAVRRPELARGFVIGNTFAWPLVDDPRVRGFSRLMGGVVGRTIGWSFNGVVRFFLAEGIRSKLSRKERAMYLAPFARRSARHFTWEAPRALVGAAPYLAELEAALPSLKEKPALLPWAEKDFAFQEPYLERFMATFPNHEVVRLPEAGHFWQDDAADEVTPAIRSFVAGL